MVQYFFLIQFLCLRHFKGILLLQLTCQLKSFNFLRMVNSRRFIINGFYMMSVPHKLAKMITNYHLGASGVCSLFVALRASLLLLCFAAESFVNSEDLAHRLKKGILRTLNLPAQGVHFAQLVLKT